MREDEADHDAGDDGGRPEHARHRRVLGLDRPETHPTMSLKNRLQLQQTCLIGLKPVACTIKLITAVVYEFS